MQNSEDMVGVVKRHRSCTILQPKTFGLRSRIQISSLGLDDNVTSMINDQKHTLLNGLQVNEVKKIDFTKKCHLELGRE